MLSLVSRLCFSNVSSHYIILESNVNPATSLCFGDGVADPTWLLDSMRALCSHFYLYFYLFASGLTWSIAHQIFSRIWDLDQTANTPETVKVGLKYLALWFHLQKIMGVARACMNFISLVHGSGKIDKKTAWSMILMRALPDIEADHIFILFIDIYWFFDVMIKYGIATLLQVSVVIRPFPCPPLLCMKWWNMACSAQRATCQAAPRFDPRWLPWEPTWMHSVRAKVGFTEAGSKELAKDTLAVCFHAERRVSVCFAHIPLTKAMQPPAVALLPQCCTIFGQWRKHSPIVSCPKWL